LTKDSFFLFCSPVFTEVLLEVGGDLKTDYFFAVGSGEFTSQGRTILCLQWESSELCGRGLSNGLGFRHIG
jgi:hypothetical protein